MKTFHNFYSVLCILLILPLSILQGQNTDLPVGTLPGTADVSSLGAATYTIPIEVVPGTQGIQPSLSITYNSISGTGSLGMGFSLTGFSAVCRKGQTDFHDNNITPIALTYDDRFELDGNRLVNSNASQYGLNGTVYYKEFYDYSKIISYGTAGNGPQYFKVFTDNGQVLEYGNSADSRHTLGNGSTVLNWYLNKVTDLNGNYMTYTYGKSGNEMWIDRIDYTGNEAAGLSPYARVQFEYDTGIHVGTVFAAGYAIRLTRLLRAVKVLYKNNGSYELVRQYNLSYSNDSPKKLVSVQLMAADSSVLNPTVFQWNNSVSEGIDTSVLVMPSMSYDKGHLAVDIDKDGSCDFVEYASNGWQAFLKYGSSYVMQHSESSPSGYHVTHCIPADLDGDGFSEIITAYRNPSDDKAFVTATYYPFETELLMDTMSSVTSVYGLLSGDFLGEGTHQVLFRYNQNYAKLIGGYSSAVFTPGAAVASPADFDGDGVMELIVLSNPLKVFKYNKGACQFSLLKSIRFNNCIATGDFNGDGICDMLFRKNDGSYGITIGTGNRFNGYVALNISLYHNCMNMTPVVADINSDGWDDILTFSYSNTLGLKILNYTSAGYYNDTLHFSGSNNLLMVPAIPSNSDTCFDYSITFGDYNGDKNLDMIFFHRELMDCNVIFYEFGEQDKRKRIFKVTEGSGAFTEWKYKYIDGMYYWYASNINIAPYHFNVVDTMTVSMGSTTEKCSFKYQFDLPAYSFKRRNMMGFMFTSVSDILHATSNITHYQNMSDFQFFTGDKHFLMPYRQMYKVNNTLTTDRYFMSECGLLPPNRLLPRITTDSTINYLDSTVKNNHNLYELNGRMISSRSDSYAMGESSYLTRQMSECSYRTQNLSNGATLTYIDSSSITSSLRGSSLSAITISTLSYDSNGHLYAKSSTMDGITVTETVNTYDLFGNATSVTTSGTGCTSRTSSFLYDNTGRFAMQHTNPKGHIFQKAYDPRTGLVLSETDENNLTTTYTYDVFGAPDSIHYPDGTSTKFFRHWYTGTTIPNACWCTVTRTTGKANVEEYYDLLHRTVCLRRDGCFSDTRYNNKGLIAKTSAPYTNGTSEAGKVWHSYQYDMYGRVTHETAPYTDLSYSYSARTRTVTDNLRETSSSKTTDAAGRIVQASDPGGNIQYTYNFDTYNGKTVFKTNVTTSGNTTSILADQRGNRVKISDPDAGIVTCTYNAFGEPVSQTDARGITTAMTYDVLGRVIGKTYSDSTGFLRTVLYTYDQHSSSNKGRGKLSYTTLNGTVSESFLYDNVGRLSQKSKTIDTTSYTETYAYNSNGLISSLSCPDGYAINFGYKSNGWLESVRQASNSKLLYKVYTYNKFGQPTRCEYGNGLASDLEYNSNGLLVRTLTGNKHISGPIKPLWDDNNGEGRPVPDPGDSQFTIDSTIQNFRYTYDNMGRLVQRSQKNSQYEAFIYDNLDRLTSFTQGTIGGATQAFSTTYDLQGNILSSSLAGTYQYEGSKPHAVTSVTPSSGFPDAISSAQCETEYNCLGQPSRIAEGNVEILLEYGADGQRTKAEFKTNGHVVRTHYYISANYEKEIDSRGAVTHYHYIYGANGLAAVCMRRGSTDKLFYVHPDRLGSYTHITDENKQVLRALHFDPWGNVKTDTNWTVFAGNAPSSLYLSYRFDRGFTGHEHYADLKIINMNGRLYDPVIARFFSPDNFVQVPDFTQSYNRYSYCLNNPLQYVDPSGEFAWIPIVVGAAIGMVQGAIMASQNANSAGEWVGYILGGGAIGALSGLAGAGIGQALASAGIGGVVGGGISGAATGAISGFSNGLTYSLISGIPFEQAMKNAGKQSLIGLGTGALFGAIGGGFQAYMEHKNIWLGKDIAMGRTPWSFRNTDLKPTHFLSYVKDTHKVYYQACENIEKKKWEFFNTGKDGWYRGDDYRTGGIARYVENYVDRDRSELSLWVEKFVGSKEIIYGGWVDEGCSLMIYGDDVPLLETPLIGGQSYSPSIMTVPSYVNEIVIKIEGTPLYPTSTIAVFKTYIYGVYRN